MTPVEVVAEARTWLKTPYHKGARVKGAGVDCGLILLDILLRAGFLSPEDAAELERLAPIGQDWFEHSEEEKYMRLVIRHARHVLTAISFRVPEARPGFIALTRHNPSSPRFNHGGIVTSWPFVIHAVLPCVEEINASQHPMWMNREVAFFDPWAKVAP